MLPNTNSQKQAGAFLRKTYSILSDPVNSSIISWDSEGRIVRILNTKDLEDIVLPKCFRHTNVKSFIRQLNMYGFKKVKRSQNSNSFYHPYFTKDNQENILLIKRKKKLRHNQEIQKLTEQKQSQTQENTTKFQSQSTLQQKTCKSPQMIIPQSLPTIERFIPIYTEPTYLYEMPYRYIFQDFPDNQQRLRGYDFGDTQPLYGYIYR